MVLPMSMGVSSQRLALWYVNRRIASFHYSDLASTKDGTHHKDTAAEVNDKSSLSEPSRLPSYAEVFPYEARRLSQPVHVKQDNYGGVGFRPQTITESLVGPGGISNAIGVNWLRSGWNLYRDHGLDWLLPYVMRVTRRAADDRHSYHAFKFFKIKELQQAPSAALQRQMGWQLLASHCVMRLGGAVQLQGSSRWLTSASRLPQLRRPDILVEALDCSSSHLMCDGFRNYLENLHALKFLRLQRAPFVDDHCLSSVARIPTLIYLDISHCHQVTANGVATLWKLPDLRRLELTGLDRVPHIHEVVLQLMELRPELTVTGLLALESDAGLQRSLAAEDVQHPLDAAEDELRLTGADDVPCAEASQS